jgi:hypothetical protein
MLLSNDRLCGLVVRVPGYRSGGPGFDFRHYKKSSGSGMGSTHPREHNWGVNGTICVAEKQSVSSDVWTEFLNII